MCAECDAFVDIQETNDGRVIETRHFPVEQGGCVRTYSDITERKAAEDEIKRQKDIADLAMENMDQGIMLVDKDWIWSLTTSWPGTFSALLMKT